MPATAPYFFRETMLANFIEPFHERSVPQQSLANSFKTGAEQTYVERWVDWPKAKKIWK